MNCADCQGISPSAPWWSSERFLPRGGCGSWIEWIQVLYQYASLIMFAVYIGMFAILWLGAAPTRARVALSLVFFTCGVGHAEGFLAFGLPAYHVFALWHAMSAVVSSVGMVLVWRAIHTVDSENQ